jgi:hypothetical protein
MVVADAWMTAVPVGVIVGCGNSGSVGVFVLVSERSGSGWGVVVISGGGVGVGVGNGSGSDVGIGGVVGAGEVSADEISGVKLGVTLAVGVSVGVGVGVEVRHGPSVDLARYCGHSSSWIVTSRIPPGKDSQIGLF